MNPHSNCKCFYCLNNQSFFDRNEQLEVIRYHQMFSNAYREPIGIVINDVDSFRDGLENSSSNIENPSPKSA